MPLRNREWTILVALLDLLALNGGLWLSLRLVDRMGLPLSVEGQDVIPFLVVTGLWLPLAGSLDAYDVLRKGDVRTSLYGAAKAAVVMYVLFLILALALPLGASPATVALAGGTGVPLIVAARGLVAIIQPRFRRRTAIVGTGPEGGEVGRLLAEQGKGAYELLGWIDRDERRHETVDAHAILGPLSDMGSVVAEQQVETIVWTLPAKNDDSSVRALAACLAAGCEVVTGPSLYESLQGRIPLTYLEGSGANRLPLAHAGTSLLYRSAKRISDIVLASLGLLFLGVVFPLIALAVYLDSPGPIFYTQNRVGRGGRVFRAYKFRSMIPQAEATGRPAWAEEKDSRITRVGRLLRATHLDEFPQFVNILRGEMSAVGPRPERPAFVKELEQEIPHYQIRHAVKPGMAGWGLVKQGYAASKEDTVRKLEYDLFYIKHQSLWLDLVILLKTFVDTFTLGGR